jgi:hypothetical protein
MQLGGCSKRNKETDMESIRRSLAELFRKPNRTLRLTFSYQGNQVQLISRQSVEMISPPSEPIVGEEEQAGFWYELRDAQDLILYRRAINNPIEFAVEVRTDDPERPLARQQITDPQGIFVLLMPDLTEARTLVIFSSPLEPEAAIAIAPARELARFNITQNPESEEVAL